MREILFRGKRIDNGEWVYGYLSYLTEQKAVIIVWSNDGYNFEEFEVIPETVGQYLELTDINNNKIFEKDILKAEVNNEDRKYDIVYVWYMAPSWKLKSIHDVGSYDLSDFGYGEKIDDLEIIGNYIDNPELLGDKK